MKLPRELHVYLRFLGYVLWEFRWALLIFWGLVLLGGLAFHLGYDNKPLNSELADEVRALNVPIIPGNGRSPKVLEQAGVREAHAVILATDDDLANIDAALTAHDMNPKLRVVLRLFDESLAVKFTSHFAMSAI